MNDMDFDALAEDADNRQGRRSALKAFGAAALAAASIPLATEAKKNNTRKKNRKKRDRAKQKCELVAAERFQSQVAPCQDLVRTSCGDDVNCVAKQLPCCDALGTCDALGFFACISET